MRRLVAAIGALVVVEGCSTAELGDGQFSRVDRSSQSSVLTLSVIPGYRHTAARSRLALGQVQLTDHVFEFDRAVGAHGVAATGRHGVFLGVLNSDSPAELVPPFSDKSEIHNARVVRYFGDAGLPADQIGEVHATTPMMQDGPVDVRPATNAGRARLVGFTTVVDRQVGGVRVAGSYAWARFNANDDVVAEEVFWPDVGTSVFSAAVAMRENLTNPTLRSEWQRKVGPGKGCSDHPERDVTIFHSPHYQEQFENFAAVRCIDGQGVEHRLEVDGRERRFEFELRRGPTLSKRPVNP